MRNQNVDDAPVVKVHASTAVGTLRADQAAEVSVKGAHAAEGPALRRSLDRIHAAKREAASGSQLTFSHASAAMMFRNVCRSMSTAAMMAASWSQSSGEDWTAPTPVGLFRGSGADPHLGPFRSSERGTAETEWTRGLRAPEGPPRAGGFPRSTPARGPRLHQAGTRGAMDNGEGQTTLKESLIGYRQTVAPEFQCRGRCDQQKAPRKHRRRAKMQW